MSWHFSQAVGGFPCTDISIAGKGAGIEGKQSSLWKEMFRIICEVRPKFVFVENSPMLTKRGLDRVLRDLASVGFNAEWGVLGADNAGAPHIRKRIWILAYSGRLRWGRNLAREIKRNRRREKTSLGASTAVMLKGSGPRPEAMADSYSFRKQQPEGDFEKKRRRTCDRSKEVSDTNRVDGHGRRSTSSAISFKPETGIPKCEWWESEPEVGRVVNGMANRLDQLRALGNGQVPEVVRLA
ncbi:DNA cytosine methyltransferase [Leptospira alexanderi]|nr:DNA cytosine methyltransferase [Leptospira alexanderi]